MNSDVVIVAAGLLAALAAGLCTVAITTLTSLTRARVTALADLRPAASRRLAANLPRREDAVQVVLLARTALLLVVAGATMTVAGDLGGGRAVQWLALVLLMPVLQLVAVTVPRAWTRAQPTRAASVASKVVAASMRLPPLRLPARLGQQLALRLAPAPLRTDRPTLEDLADLAELNERAESAAEEPVGSADAGSSGPSANGSEAPPYEGLALLSSVVEFGRTVTKEIMVPRPDMVTLRASQPVNEAWRLAHEEGYSRYPVEGRDIDDVVGVAYARDLLRAAVEGREGAAVTELMHPAWFVPETKKVSSLLREMQHEKLHLAVVVDEYGGTAGLVTLEDVLEELVGDIDDEFDVDTPPLYQRLDDGRVRLDARLAVEEANDHLERPLPQGHWDTVAGLVFATMGRVPRPGDSAEVDGQRIEVERVVGRRIATVLVGSEP